MSHQYDNTCNPVHVDYRNSEPEQRKAYKRMERQAGKGDLARNIYSNAFRDGWDRIFKRRSRSTH